MNWAEEHLDSNETDVMHMPASDIYDSGLYDYCTECETKFEEPQESPYCDSCSDKRKIKSLNVRVGELERELKGWKRFGSVICDTLEDDIRNEPLQTDPAKLFVEGMVKEKELLYELMQNMGLV